MTEKLDIASNSVQPKLHHKSGCLEKRLLINSWPQNMGSLNVSHDGSFTFDSFFYVCPAPEKLQ
jgi:hypothetical protein